MNCTQWRSSLLDSFDPTLKANPDIAGIGIISAFIASAAFALCLSGANLVLTASILEDVGSTDRRIFRLAHSLHLFEVTDARREFWIPVIEKVVLALSDQQLITGLAVLTAGFSTHCSILVYHFTLMSDLAWFSGNVHLATFRVRQKYTTERTLDRHGRAMLMGCFAIMLLASCVMQGHYAWYESWAYNAQCLFNNLPGNMSGIPAFSKPLIVMVFIFSYLTTIMGLYRNPSRLMSNWLIKKPRKIFERCRKHYQDSACRSADQGSSKSKISRLYCHVMLLGISITRHSCSVFIALLVGVANSHCALFAMDISWFVYGIWNILCDRAIPGITVDGNENEMTFGQIMPLLLLSSTVFVIREAYIDQDDRLYRNSHSPVNNFRHSSSHSRMVSGESPTINEAIQLKGSVQNSDAQEISAPTSCGDAKSLDQA